MEDVASVLVGGEEFVIKQDSPFVFGRADAEGVIGLDGNDMGISAISGSVEASWGVWWIVNQSGKRPLLLEYPTGPGRVRLEPGHRHAVMTERINVLVPGAIYTHLLEVVLPDAYVAALKGSSGRLTSGTITSDDRDVTLTNRERDALIALCSGYLESFPHRRDQPTTYLEGARLLGEAWTADMVRKAIERVKGRFAKEREMYFEGTRANDELASHAVASGLVTGADLGRLPGRRHAAR